MLSNTSKPLTPETVLEAGKIYFLLPYSLFDSGVSPTDFAAIAKKLASKAKNDHRSKSKSKKKYKTGGNSAVWSSPVNISPSRLSSDSETENDHFGIQRSSKSRLWKPELDTIREKSFNQRSESELVHENIKVDSE
ncbi:hypothetical protein PHJA_000579900 [Phtheirospermum japonicum]|uniref:Uncharacterized protein n=1 Tax=Phtheirospermum japonicum TaxID=374723 RepID=A0A830BQR8_9LAMI|nr:hypothetical protein PHJA_000579900 [Phtheirospermum japonicum]